MLAPKGRAGRLQRRTLSHLRSLCSRLSRRLSGPPSSALSPLPYPYRVIGMVMIGFRDRDILTFDSPGRVPPRSSRASAGELRLTPFLRGWVNIDIMPELW